VAALAAAALVLASARGTDGAVVIGSKNFTEQVILGELIAQAIEDQGGVPVVRKLNLGGTFVCDRALRAGELDVYVEYTGTAVNAIFRQEVPHDSAAALARAKALYATAGITVADPLGFNNTFAILVRDDDGAAHDLRSIDDLRRVAAEWRPGFGYEFLQREDGYAGLTAAYNLEFGAAPRGMELSLIYRALATGQVDVIAGDATSALIDALHLRPLADTRHYFPPYDAVPLVRSATMLRAPAVGRALARLAGRISDRDMRAMNAAVDVSHRDVRAVAAEFLASLAPS
jgi:glycine betaine/choline ABC-type transport system substrate-binding protein